MLGHILEINDNSVVVELSIDINEQPNLVNLHAIFEDGNKRVVGEISNISQTKLIANIVGELTENGFIPGSSFKPSFKSNVRLIKSEELEYLLGNQQDQKGMTLFGTSNVYENYKINVSINDFFSNHFAVLGNSGSGKSCTVASIIQNLFKRTKTPPLRSNIIFFDAFGEYTNAFSELNNVDNGINYKVYTTNPDDGKNAMLHIPVWLLDVDDLALLLDANTPTQLPIIEKTLKLVPILTGNNADVMKRKNDIIARAIMDILLSGGESTKIRDQVTAILTKFNTTDLNLESPIAQPGYVRSLKQCLYIDKTGKMQEMELVVEFMRTFVVEELEELDPSKLNKFYTLKDLESAMDFALISEGILKSEKVFDYANVISVRLHSLANGEYSSIFEYPKYITKDEYINELTTSKMNGGKCQIISFNISYVDDRIAKVITKIISRMLFTKAVTNRNRGSEAYHIMVEEAHRYIQKDIDVEILGYNIFERITKEGRKYGIFLGIITQRPSELSDTTISQCSNFMILRTLHPKDLEYIRNMVPNISSEIVLQLKNLKPGNCIAFGSAFKVPISMYINLPNPRPLSDNVNLERVWYQDSNIPTSELQSMVNATQSTSVNSAVVQNQAPNQVVNTAQRTSVNSVVAQAQPTGQVYNNIPNQQQVNSVNSVSNNKFINTNNTVNS